MGKPTQSNEFQSFIDSQKPPTAGEDELVKLAEHAEKGPKPESTSDAVYQKFMGGLLAILLAIWGLVRFFAP